MTESEWLACPDSRIMLEFLRGKASNRKLRLFAVACCRRVWNLLTDERSRRGVETVERFVDGKVAREAWVLAKREAHTAAGELVSRSPRAAERREAALDQAQANAATAAAEALQECSVWGLVTPAEMAAEHSASLTALAIKKAARSDGLGGRPSARRERAAQCYLLRDIFGNPFRPASIDAAWLSPEVMALTQTIYEERAFDRMHELADALEAAGCHDADILAHCRLAGPHVRGCWVVDSVLGKS